MQKFDRHSSPIIKSKLLKQWGKNVIDFSSQYGSSTSISYTASNLAEETSIYPNYGDFTQACVLRTYGPWWNKCSGGDDFNAKKPDRFTAQDYIDLSFHEAVFPEKIEIYETYHPGAIVRILACDVDPESTESSTDYVRWFVLWSGTSPFRSMESHIFSPDLHRCPFATNLLRFEFNHVHCEYYMELDGVQLTGFRQRSTNSDPTSTNSSPRFSASECLHCFRNSQTPSSSDTELVTSVGEQALHASCDNVESGPRANDLDTNDISVSVNGDSSSQQTLVSQSELITKGIAKLHLQDGLSAVLDFTDNGSFDLLPEEVIQHILCFLDLPDLGNLACVCRLFHKHCYDSHQCTELNLQPYWPKVTNTVLQTMLPRCRHLQKLNLSWCGSYNHLSGNCLTDFVQSCGRELVSLKLACCSFVDDVTLKAITTSATQLKTVDLQGCRNISNRGFLKLCLLSKLTTLNLYRTRIDVHAAIAVIRSCEELEHLNLGSCEKINNSDEVAGELAASCKKLKTLDLWRARTFTHAGVVSLAQNCPDLVELDIGWSAAVQSFNGCIVDLVKKCRKLKKLFLTANRGITSDDLVAIATHLKDLEQLDILGTREVSEEAVLMVLKECKKLCLYDVSFCGRITQSKVEQWRKEFPHVSIKKSFQD